MLMDFIVEFFKAVIMAALPVGALSFGIVWWALHKGYLKERDGVKALRQEIKSLGKKRSREKKKINPLHDKWFKLGGGFYGIVGLYTYALVEWNEITDLLGNLGRVFTKFSPGIFINFFIESITNFIIAVTWPIYWMNEVSSDWIWMWLVLAYGGYWAGMKLAQQPVIGGVGGVNDASGGDGSDLGENNSGQDDKPEDG